MKRAIAGFHADAGGNWVAELSCWHNQHVRHQPPFRQRPWVLEPAGRAARVGSLIDCPLCDRKERPEGLVLLDRAGPWDEISLPDALRRTHRTPRQRWGELRILAGAVGFQLRPDDTEPDPVTRLVAGAHQAIPPEVAHRVIPLGPARLELELWGPAPDEGGDPACWAGLLCPACGAVMDGGPHRPDCSTIGSPRPPDR